MASCSISKAATGAGAVMAALAVPDKPAVPAGVAWDASRLPAAETAETARRAVEPVMEAREAMVDTL
jgi:hypothetical protein